MTDIKARLIEGADRLDKAPVVLDEVATSLLAQWLRTEAACLAGDEDHTTHECTASSCTAIAALELAESILKGKT